MKTALMWLLALFMVFAGTMHFVRADGYVAIMPSYLPWHFELVYISGFFEILGGIGLLIPQTRRWAAWGLIALFIAVFPANVNMAVNQLPFMGKVYPTGNWVRLPFQLAFIAWAYWFARNVETHNDNGKAI